MVVHPLHNIPYDTMVISKVNVDAFISTIIESGVLRELVCIS
jgi:hypothetical protein